jgi:hypothetical protein
VSACQNVEQRGAHTLKWAQKEGVLVDIALNYLVLAQAALYRAILQQSKSENSTSEIAKALDGLRAAGTMDHLPRGLVIRAWVRFVGRDEAGAKADLDEAQEIAERGGMKLHLADIHLYRGRRFGDRAELAKARELIKECGYHRRDGELQDAEKALGIERI